MKRYLTKSRFNIAIECPPKLYYSNKPAEYADNNLDDAFLAALAEGGFQVGELAKFLFSKDPYGGQITVEEKNYEKALEITNQKLFQIKNSVVAEAAFEYKNLFIRVDIATRKEKVINIYEVKAKSWNSKKDFWVSNKKTGLYLERSWLPYLYDIAFQKWVVMKAWPEYKVNAHLIFADSDTRISIDGLSQLFRIEKTGERTRIKVAKGTTAKKLGTIPLKIIPVDKECEWIYEHPVDVEVEGIHSFEGIIQLFSDSYQKDQRIWTTLGSKCKTCEFVNTNSDLKLKSGFAECWKHMGGLTDEQLKLPLVLELWGGLAGARSYVNEVIAKRKFFMSSLDQSDYWPKEVTPKIGLHPAERRRWQITKIKTNDRSPFLDIPGLRKIFDEYEPPYHFIDFETTMAALPFHVGRKPYEPIAFQYSYHLMDEKGAVKHKSQYLSLSKEFPNYDFVRALKNDLQGVPGTIFRYHKHENTYLRFIKKQLEEEPAGLIADSSDLIDFIQEITNKKDEGWCGPNDMKDLFELVISYYYSPAAKGSNSIKDILPAVILDSAYIRDKYSRPIYGTAGIPSLNFKDHTWITPDHGMNPYKTLPSVLKGYDNDQLDQFVPGMDEIREGGAAMMAYAYLQFSDVPYAQKESIKNALFRYCELDTFAMVMIWEYWGKEVGRW